MNAITETDLILNKDGSVYHLNLLPEHLGNTVITVGDPNRVDCISQYFDRIEYRISKREFVTHTGYYRNKRVTVMSTGMGTDNIEICLIELDALVNIDLKNRQPKASPKKLKIIRIGTSGSLQEDIQVDTHLVSEYAVGFDNLMNFYDLRMDEFELRLVNDIQQKSALSFKPYVVKGSERLCLQIGFDMIKGNTVTTPGFYAPQGRTTRVSTLNSSLLENLRLYKEPTANFRLTNFEMETSGYYGLGRILGHEILSVNAILANRVTHQFSNNPDKVVDSLIQKVLDRI